MVDWIETPIFDQLPRPISTSTQSLYFKNSMIESNKLNIESFDPDNCFKSGIKLK